ncbi:hypothetical protein SUGI_0763290 [Cryptomeria japonica]|nr:hypothetical protein SUGI_0763290 [Cryptomeria japonica]
MKTRDREMVLQVRWITEQLQGVSQLAKLWLLKFLVTRGFFTMLKLCGTIEWSWLLKFLVPRGYLTMLRLCGAIDV